MKISMLVVGALAMGLGACAAPSSSSSEDDGAQPGIVDGTSEDAITSGDRKAQLDGLRARVQKDFANAPTLRGYKLVFVVRRLNGDAKKAAVQAHIMKRNAQGKDAELSDADFRGSAYEDDIREGFFDGPEVTAILAKGEGATWSTMKKGEGADAREAYVVGPTDVAYEDWDREFGVPRAWLGL